MTRVKDIECLPCPFCGGECDPEGWLDGNGERGPECETCGATTTTVNTWNHRVNPLRDATKGFGIIQRW